MKAFLYCLAIILICHVRSYTQEFDSLNRLNNSNVFFSDGFQDRSQRIASFVNEAMDYYAAELSFKPEVTVLVLKETDWSKYTSMPVYGMPHYTSNKTLIVAATDNAMWRSFIPDLTQLPEALTREIKQTYTDKDGNLTMERFFDLLALHELGHAFHLQGGLNVQRKWMGELFCNLFLHTYVAERSPGHLKALTVFPEMVVSAGSDQFSFKTLKQFEENYSILGPRHPKNYGWYQCRLHVGAKQIYNTTGKRAFLRLWTTLKSKDKIESDEEFAEMLRQKVDPAVSDVFRRWSD